MTTPPAPAESDPPAEQYWLAALPRTTYADECAAIRRRGLLRRAIREGTVPDMVAERYISAADLTDPNY